MTSSFEHNPSRQPQPQEERTRFSATHPTPPVAAAGTARASLQAALRLHEKELPDGLRVTKYAYKRAGESGFRNTQLFSEVVRSIARGRGEFGAVKELLKALGKRARCSPRDSKETMNAFGHERRFLLDDGTKVECQQHVTLGHGQRNANETLHVYFRRHGDKAEILYVGEHLKTVSGNT